MLRYDINLGQWGSFFIYSIEYRWTKNEINVITLNITTERLSNIKDQVTLKSPELIQLNVKTEIWEPNNPTSTIANKQKIKHVSIQKVEMKFAPFCPKNRPQRPQINEPKKGINIMIKYILN